MSKTRQRIGSESVLASILASEAFWPSEPRSFEETGLPVATIEALVCKRLAICGASSGRQLANTICLPFHILSDVLKSLRERHVIVHSGSAPFNDYNYTLTELGLDRARGAMKSCSYVGPAPVPLSDYVTSAEAQTIRAESPRREQLLDAFADISVNQSMFDSLGPAINSGAGLFLYGEPGNGKSTLARRITRCFGQKIWIPQTVIEDGQVIKLYDPALHRAAKVDEENSLANSTFDRRWIKIERPTVVVGGELTMDALELRHDPVGNVSEAPLQMKANCGCFLIDDFGRQRIEPTQLLNRWIVPLESRFDFLTLPTGKKIQVPFEQLIIFSTNLEPGDLADEAFLRRIPYKIHVCDPDHDEFHDLFEIYAQEFGCAYRSDVVDYLMQQHYQTVGRPMRRCQPRDLLSQIRNYCIYNDLPMEMRDEYFDRVVASYFAVVVNTPAPIIAKPAPAGAATQRVVGAVPKPVPAATSATRPPAVPSRPVAGTRQFAAGAKHVAVAPSASQRNARPAASRAPATATPRPPRSVPPAAQPGPAPTTTDPRADRPHPVDLAPPSPQRA